MPSINTEEFEFEEEVIARHAKTARPNNERKRASARTIADLIEHDAKTDAVAMGAGSGFTPTFKAHSQERRWILDSLGPFHDTNLILDVLARVKGGKEATVYCCSATPTTGVEYLAAKVYRPRMFRNLSNDAQYREGRSAVDEAGKSVVKDRRAKHAIAKKTHFGQELLHGSWLYNEYNSLQHLQGTGIPVPKVYGFGNNALLMEYLGEPGNPAPMLEQVRLPREEAGPLFDQLVESIGAMLARGRIHADLSAFNVLYWEGEIRIIDFPQSVDAYFNPSAYAFFERDVRRICQYFARYMKVPDAASLAASMWAAQMPGSSTDIQSDRAILLEKQRVHGMSTNGQRINE
jgi:RIO kinase 1